MAEEPIMVPQEEVPPQVSMEAVREHESKTQKNATIAIYVILVVLLVAALAVIIWLAVTSGSSKHHGTGCTGKRFADQWAVLQIAVNQAVTNNALIDFGTTPVSESTPYAYFTVTEGETGATRIVANTQGLFQFSTSALITPTATTGSVAIHFNVNGSTLAYDKFGYNSIPVTPQVNPVSLSTTASIPMSANDFVEIQVTLPGASTISNATVPSLLQVLYSPTSSPEWNF
jgi:hypothetical protein